MVVYHVTNTIIQPAYMLQHENVPRFANNQTKFRRWVSHAYEMSLEQIKRLYGPFGWILGIFQACLWSNQYFLLVIAVARPWSPDLLSSLMPNTRELAFEWRLPFAVLHSYILATFAQGFLMLLRFEILLILATTGLFSQVKDKKQHFTSVLKLRRT